MTQHRIPTLWTGPLHPLSWPTTALRYVHRRMQELHRIWTNHVSFSGGSFLTPAKQVGPLALGIALVACGATDSSPVDVRYPCDGEKAWDPTVPLFVQWDDANSGSKLPIRTPAFRSGIQLSTADGKVVEFFLANTGGGSIVICPEGGLDPATEYVWSIGPFETKSNNSVDASTFEAGVSWSFVTDDIGDNKPISDAAACRAVSPKVYDALSCDIDDTGATNP